MATILQTTSPKQIFWNDTTWIAIETLLIRIFRGTDHNKLALIYVMPDPKNR